MFMQCLLLCLLKYTLFYPLLPSLCTNKVRNEGVCVNMLSGVEVLAILYTLMSGGA